MGTIEAWPGKAADAAIHAAVLRNRSLFVRFAEFDIDDLFQEARMACERAWPNYKPDVAAWSTYLSMVTRRRLIDICRGRSRRAERERAVAVRDWEGQGPAVLAEMRDWVDAGDEAGLPGGAGGDDETLAEWLGKVYRQAVHKFPARRGGRGGRNWFTPPQIVAVVLLMRKRSLSTRGAKLLLEQDEDLCKALQLRHVPNHSWFHRAKSFATDNLGIPAATQRRITGHGKADKADRQSPQSLQNSGNATGQMEGRVPGHPGPDRQRERGREGRQDRPRHRVRRKGEGSSIRPGLE